MIQCVRSHRRTQNSAWVHSIVGTIVLTPNTYYANDRISLSNFTKLKVNFYDLQRQTLFPDLFEQNHIIAKSIWPSKENAPKFKQICIAAWFCSSIWVGRKKIIYSNINCFGRPRGIIWIWFLASRQTAVWRVLIGSWSALKRMLNSCASIVCKCILYRGKTSSNRHGVDICEE